MRELPPRNSTGAHPDADLDRRSSHVAPTKAPRIVGLGVACLDHLFVAPPVPPGHQTRVRDSATEGGGLVATALVAAARLGARAEIRTWIGDDPEGDLVLSGLEQEGIDASGIVVVPGAVTAVSFIHVTEGTGERTIFHRRGPAPTKAQMDAASRIEGAYDAVLVDATWPKASLALARNARKAGVPVVADFCPQLALRALAGVVDALIVPRTCAEQLSPNSDWADRLGALRELGPSLVVITAGADGCYYLNHDRAEHFPAFRTEVTDTTGAGDVFHGAFAYGLAARLPLRECVALASATAALSCRALGGRRAIPTYQQVAQFLREQTRSHEGSDCYLS